MTDPCLQIGANELCLMLKGDEYRRGEFIYLKLSSICCEMFQRVHPKRYLTNF